MWNKFKNSRVAQLIGFSWLVCMISHVIIPFFIALPLFRWFMDHGHHDECSDHGHVAEQAHDCMSTFSFQDLFMESLIFIIFIIPVSLIVTLIWNAIKRRNKKHITICENCPNKEILEHYDCHH